MPTPFSISAFPVRGYNIAEDVVGVNTLMQSPLAVAGRPLLNAWECYNYKSSGQVTGCNLPGGNDRFLEPRRGAASRHCSYENNTD